MLYFFLQTIQKPSDLTLQLTVFLYLFALTGFFLMDLLLDFLPHELLLILLPLYLSFGVDRPSFECFLEQHETVELFGEL